MVPYWVMRGTPRVRLLGRQLRSTLHPCRHPEEYGSSIRIACSDAGTCAAAREALHTPVRRLGSPPTSMAGRRSGRSRVSCIKVKNECGVSGELHGAARACRAGMRFERRVLTRALHGRRRAVAVGRAVAGCAYMWTRPT